METLFRLFVVLNNINYFCYIGLHYKKFLDNAPLPREIPKGIENVQM